MLGTTGKQHGIEVLSQLRWCHRLLGPVGDFGTLGQVAHHHTGAKPHTLDAHLIYPAVDMRFLHLEIRYAVSEQTTDPVVLLEHGDVMTRTRQLLRRRHAGRARADHGNRFAGLVFRDPRFDPAVCPGMVDDRVFNRLDTHRVVIHVQRAGCLTRRGADTAGEFREVVGAVQDRNRIFPVAPVHQLVEVRNDIVDRATTVAKRRAAVHATRALRLGLRVVQREHEFLVILDALRHRAVPFLQPPVFHKARNFSHFSVLNVSVVAVFHSAATWPRPLPFFQRRAPARG